MLEARTYAEKRHSSLARNDTSSPGASPQHAMTVKDAKEAARQWMMAEGIHLPGFCGAFFHGSIAWLPDDAILPATSDVDVMVVLADADPPEKPGKFRYRDVLLEVSYLSRDRPDARRRLSSAGTSWPAACARRASSPTPRAG